MGSCWMQLIYTCISEILLKEQSISLGNEETADFAELLLLWLSVGALMLFCGRYSKIARWALLPYLLWVTAAGALNWKVVELNGPFG